MLYTYKQYYILYTYKQIYMIKIKFTHTMALDSK